MNPLALLLILIVAVLGVRWALEWSRRQGTAFRRTLLTWFGIGVLLLLAVTGKLGLIVPLLATLLAATLRLAPVLLQFLPILQRAWRQQSQRPRTGGDSNLSSADAKYLHLELNHATGEISGRVVGGRFAGRDLHRMDLPELLELHRECRQDDQDSASLLEAYLDRVHGEGWRTAGSKADARSASRSEISREEAYRVLGLNPGASKEAIIQAHRRLMQKLHPDRGGSDYLAAEINRAKAILLGNS